MSVRAVLVLDDGVYLVRRDGTLERLLAPGHPRPGCAHATAFVGSAALCGRGVGEARARGRLVATATLAGDAAR